MNDDDRVLDAARAIRTYLPSLLDPEEAADVDRALAELLAEPATSRDLNERVLAQLDKHDVTAEWAGVFVEHGFPPDLVKLLERGYGPPAGSGDPVIVKYGCPHGDYVWYRHAVGQALHICPSHGVVVERLTPA
jgi:hypothetical protein